MSSNRLNEQVAERVQQAGASASSELVTSLSHSTPPVISLVGVVPNLDIKDVMSSAAASCQSPQSNQKPASAERLYVNATSALSKFTKQDPVNHSIFKFLEDDVNSAAALQCVSHPTKFTSLFKPVLVNKIINILMDAIAYRRPIPIELIKNNPRVLLYNCNEKSMINYRYYTGMTVLQALFINNRFYEIDNIIKYMPLKPYLSQLRDFVRDLLPIHKDASYNEYYYGLLNSLPVVAFFALDDFRNSLKQVRNKARDVKDCKIPSPSASSSSAQVVVSASKKINMNELIALNWLANRVSSMLIDWLTSKREFDESSGLKIKAFKKIEAHLAFLIKKYMNPNDMVVTYSFIFEDMHNVVNTAYAKGGYFEHVKKGRIFKDTAEALLAKLAAELNTKGFEQSVLARVGAEGDIDQSISKIERQLCSYVKAKPNKYSLPYRRGIKYVQGSDFDDLDINENDLLSSSRVNLCKK